MYKKESSITSRNLNFEFLRIISMLFIVAHHYSLYSHNEITDPFHFSNLFLDFLKVGGKYGVILFILITGYFSIDKKYERKRVLKTILHTEFYSYLFFFIMILLKQEIHFQELRYSLFPILFSSYWFISTYVILYLLIPYINILVDKITKRDFKVLLIILSSFIVIFPSALGVCFPIGNVLIFIYIYLLGAYLKIYRDSFTKKKSFYLFFSIFFYLGSYITIIVLKGLSLKIPFLYGMEYFYISLNSIFFYPSAISLFLFFSKIEIDSSWKKTILSFSQTTLGVYLIHENYFVRIYLWTTLLKINPIENNVFFVLSSIGTILMVYLTCSCIDYCYNLLFEKHILKLGNKVYTYFCSLFNKLLKEDL